VNFKALILLVGVAVVATACSGENKYEREADRVTRAVMNNDLRPVQGDIAKGITVTRVKVAQWSDELNSQGKLLSVKETTTCSPGWHCFDVKFQNRVYLERMRFDDQGKVVDWEFHMAPQSAAHSGDP
jgi:hypothetical protein